MQGDSKQGRGAALRTWSAPELGRVSLVADQVLGVGCKTEQLGTRAYGDATCTFRPCNTKGS
jgi:hypothetical protein